MLRYCLDKWNKNKDLLEKALKEKDDKLNTYPYLYFVGMVVKYILNGEINEDDKEGECWDSCGITEIDDSVHHDRGTILFLVPRYIWEPSKTDYLMTYARYEDDCFYAADEYTEQYMSFCKMLVDRIIKPYICAAPDEGDIWEEI